MEEVKEIDMIQETLSEKFSSKEWMRIRSEADKIFLKKQQMILDSLLLDHKMFTKYFTNFYSNHVKLLNWSMLAIDKKAEMSKYVFKSMMAKGSQYYSKQVQFDMEQKLKRKKEEKNGIDTKYIEEMEQDVYKEIFEEMVEKKNKNFREIQFTERQTSKQKEVEPIDGHDIYIKTFNACNGWNYIFYNYEKHMKGFNEKFKYNDEIRFKQQKENNQRHEDRLGLLNYEHPNMKTVPLEVLNLNRVVLDPKLNSIGGLKRMAGKSSNKKLVFQNHQGKPITFRINRF